MIVLSEELKVFCKKQYNSIGRCGRCFLHNDCAVSYIITRENIDNHVIKLNELIKKNENKISSLLGDEKPTS
jgi:hypothetical protein